MSQPSEAWQKVAWDAVLDVLLIKIQQAPLIFSLPEILNRLRHFLSLFRENFGMRK